MTTKRENETQVLVRLTADERMQLDAIAAADGRNMAGMIRKLIADEYKKNGKANIS